MLSSHGSPSSSAFTSRQPRHRLAAVAASSTASGVRRPRSATSGASIALARQGSPFARAMVASARTVSALGPAVVAASGASATAW
jgi:hypothetical protein